jgi:hypothetical protein
VVFIINVQPKIEPDPTTGLVRGDKGLSELLEKGQGELRVAGVHGSGFTGKTVAVRVWKIAVKQCEQFCVEELW